MSHDPTARSLVEDVESLMREAETDLPTETYGEPPELDEGKAGSILAKNMSPGRSLEKKSSEKRKKKGGVKKLGKGRNPFRHRQHNGPARAIPPVKKPRNVSKKDDWDCKCGNYRCLCRSGKRKKTVRINKAYKKAYNKSYKRWRSRQGS